MTIAKNKSMDSALEAQQNVYEMLLPVVWPHSCVKGTTFPDILPAVIYCFNLSLPLSVPALSVGLEKPQQEMQVAVADFSVTGFSVCLNAVRNSGGGVCVHLMQ